MTRIIAFAFAVMLAVMPAIANAEHEQYVPYGPPAPAQLGLYITDCLNRPLSGASVTVIIYRGNTQLDPIQASTDRNARVFFDLPTMCCDRVRVSVLPRGYAQPYQTDFLRSCPPCQLEGVFDLEQEIPVDDPCHPSNQQSGGPTCCNERLSDGYWQIRYRLN
jgi:hypothetical protein